MVTSLLQSFKNSNIGFSVFDQLSYSDSSLPFANVLSADRGKPGGKPGTAEQPTRSPSSGCENCPIQARSDTAAHGKEY